MMGLLVVLIIGQIGGIGGYTAGICRTPGSSVNGELSKLGMSGVSMLFMQGGAGYSLVNKVLVGGSGVGGGVKRSNDTLEVAYGVGGGYFELGYALKFSKAVYPFLMLGIGGFSEDVEIRRKIHDVSWDSVWNNPLREVKISRGSFSVAPSVGVLIFPSGSFAGIMLKATFNTIFSEGWSFGDGTELSGNPSSPLGYATLNATIVFGGISSGRENKTNH